MEPAMNIPEIIPAEVAGYCDVDTGECVTIDPVTDDTTAPDTGAPDTGATSAAGRGTRQTRR
jgi:hypothetical protein